MPAIRYTLADITEVFSVDEEFVRAVWLDRALEEIARLNAVLVRLQQEERRTR
jgi:hypothetical protein